MSSSRKLKRKTEMTIDIDKLRAAHAATTQGEWVPEPEPNGATFSLWVDTDSLVAEYNTETDADFIALAHNEFPAMLDEIERLRAEVEAHSDRAQSLMGSEAKRFDEIERLRAANEGAYALLCEFADTINNSLEGDHPNKDEVLQWITQHEDDRDD